MDAFWEWNLGVLTFLAEHRNDILTAIMAILTYIGSEYVMIALISVIFLCFDKKLAYKIGLIFFGSGAAVQITKLACRIERPWTLVDTKYTQFQGKYSAVEKFGAKAGATGYSFPSGHSQSAAALYGGLAMSVKKKSRWWLKVLLWVLPLLVMFTRLYLGVHTPFDVVVGALIALVFVFCISAVFDKLYSDKKYDIVVSAVLGGVSVVSIVFALVIKKLHPDVDIKMVSDCLKASACGVGFAIGYFVERRFIDFDPRCGSVGDKIARVIVGVGGVFAIKEGVKYLGKAISQSDGVTMAFDILRYLLVVLFALCLLPFIVKKIHGRKADRTYTHKDNTRKSRNKMRKQSKRAGQKK